MTMKQPVHPGEILRVDVLDDLGLSVTEAARRLRVVLSRVEDVVVRPLDVA